MIFSLSLPFIIAFHCLSLLPFIAFHYCLSLPFITFHYLSLPFITFYYLERTAAPRHQGISASVLPRDRVRAGASYHGSRGRPAENDSQLGGLCSFMLF